MIDRWISTVTTPTRCSSHATRDSMAGFSSASRRPASTAGRSAGCARRCARTAASSTTAAQAEAEAFRPCLKCRPEIAPGRDCRGRVMDASQTLAARPRAPSTPSADEGAPTSVARAGRTARRQRPPPAPHLPGRAWRDPAAVPADATPAARQAAADRHPAAGRRRSRWRAAFAACGASMPRSPTLPDEPDAAAPRAPDRRPRLDRAGAQRHARLPAAVRRGRAAALHRARAIPEVEVVDGRTHPAHAARRHAGAAPRAGSRRPSRRRRAGGGCASHPRWPPRAAASSPRRGAGSTSTLRPKRSTRRSPTCPAHPGCDCRAASTASSSRSARSSASRSPWPRRARWRSRLVERFGEPLATPWDGVERAFPSPRSLADATARRSPNSASSAPAPARSGALRRPGTDIAPLMRPAATRRADRAPARSARHRTVDRALHRDAHARLARRVPAERRRACSRR